MTSRRRPGSTRSPSRGPRCGCGCRHANISTTFRRAPRTLWALLFITASRSGTGPRPATWYSKTGTVAAGACNQPERLTPSRCWFDRTSRATAAGMPRSSMPRMAGSGRAHLRGARPSEEAPEPRDHWSWRCAGVARCGFCHLRARGLLEAGWRPGSVEEAQGRCTRSNRGSGRGPLGGRVRIVGGNHRTSRLHTFRAWWRAGPPGRGRSARPRRPAGPCGWGSGPGAVGWPAAPASPRCGGRSG